MKDGTVTYIGKHRRTVKLCGFCGDVAVCDECGLCVHHCGCDVGLNIINVEPLTADEPTYEPLF